MLRKHRGRETKATAVGEDAWIIVSAILFWHKHLSAVTKVMFPTIKLVRALHVPGYDFLCLGEELCLDGQRNSGWQECCWWQSAE